MRTSFRPMPREQFLQGGESMNKRLTRFAAVALTAILFACAAEYAHAMAVPAVTGSLAPAKSQPATV